MIDGSKAFITNSGTPLTSVIIVAALDEAADDGDVSTIVVPVGTPGLTVGASYRRSAGARATPTRSRSTRAACRRTTARRTRPGYAQFLETLADGRVAIAALSVGLARGCLEESVRYAGEREAFGQPIGAYQALQFKIADMQGGGRDGAARVPAGGVAPRPRAPLRDRGVDRQAVRERGRGLERAGGRAGPRRLRVRRGLPVARFYRDAKVLEIEGTSEIQRVLIARALGLPGTEL